MAYDGTRGVTVLFGGDSVLPGGDHEALDETWLWDGSNWTQQQPAIHPPAREGALMAYDEARRVVVLFGGDGYLGTPGHTVLSSMNDTWTWDGKNWTNVTPP